MTEMSDEDLSMKAVLGISEREFEAMIHRAEMGALTDQDQTKMQAAADSLSEALSYMEPALGDLLGFFQPIFGAITDLVPLVNVFLQNHGFLAQLALQPTFRTEPMPGVELGGTLRNPEDDVLDDIDRLVDWQMTGEEPKPSEGGDDA